MSIIALQSLHMQMSSINNVGTVAELEEGIL